MKASIWYLCLYIMKSHLTPDFDSFWQLETGVSGTVIRYRRFI